MSPTMDLSALARLATSDPESQVALQDRATALIHLALDEAEDMLATGTPEIKVQIVKSLVANVARTPKDDAEQSLVAQAVMEMQQATIDLLTPPEGAAGFVPAMGEMDPTLEVLVDGVADEPSEEQVSIQAGIDSANAMDLPPETSTTGPKRRRREPGRTRTGSVRPPNRTVNP